MFFDLPDPILFRPANLRDIPKIEIIEKESFSDEVQESADVFKRRIELFRDGFLVAEDRDTGELGAYICSELFGADEPVNADTLKIGHFPDESRQKDGECLYISSLAVGKAWRGHKIGAALFLALEKRVLSRYPSVRRGLLVVSENQANARTIYEKNGYSATNRLPAFFGTAEDGIVMEKTIRV